ncbi:MAG: ABC transporter substrate-binding protein [Casimicrobiaceae bacterium]
MSGNLKPAILGLTILAAGLFFAGPGVAVPPSGTLVIALVANVNTLDPLDTSTVTTDLSLISHLYSPLVIRGPDMKIKPALAKSWKAVDDNTWRFELVPNVVFPNGEKLDAAAVKWNVEHVLDPAKKSRVKLWYDAIKEVRVISPTTFEIVTKKPFPALIDQLSMFFLSAPQWTAQNTPATKAMGTGPYDLVEFKNGDHLTLKAKSNYWGEKPKFDTVIFRVMPEDSSRISALLAGEVDLITSFPPSEIKRINDSGSASAGALPSTRFMFVKYNTTIAPFKGNVKLRVALNHAVDRAAINDSLWGGLGRIADCQAISPDYFGFNGDLKPYAYDPKKAKQMLAEAGYPSGLDVTLQVPQGRYLQSNEIAQVVAAQLGEIGVRAKITEQEFGQFMKEYVPGKLGPMAYMGLGFPTLDADGQLRYFHPDYAAASYDNRKFGELVDQAAATVDPARRLKLYKEATASMCADPPGIFMFFQPTTYAESKRVRWQKRGDDWVRAYDILPR